MDKELLDTNQNAYVNKVMDAVERSEAKISNDLRVAETKTNAENNKLAASAKMLNDQQKLLEPIRICMPDFITSNSVRRRTMIRGKIRRP